MSILRHAFKVIELAERERPSLLRSGLWKVAKASLLREAVVLETEWKDGDNLGAREGSLEEEECLGTETTKTDLNAMLTEHLGKPPLGISPSSTGSQPQKIVPLTRSTRLPRT
jgi:hypothetical protein